MRDTVLTCRRALGPALILALAAGACGDGATGPAPGAILDLELGAAVQLSDSAVVVNGSPRVRLPRPSQGLRIYHSTSYEYGGIGAYSPDRVWEEQWFSRFGYELEPVERGDTVVFEYLDFGDVRLAQEDTLLKATDLPDVRNAPYPIEFVNFVLYAGTHYAWRLELNGAQITFVESPYLPRMIRGDAIAIRGSGGPRPAPCAATFSLEPLPALTGMRNGRSLSFRSQRPVIDADRDLVLSFDGPVDPATAVFALLPWAEDVPDPETRRAATLVGQLPAAADQAVIPAGSLRQLMDAVGLDDVNFILFVIRALDTGDVIPVQRIDTETLLELGVGQMDDTRLFIRIVR